MTHKFNKRPNKLHLKRSSFSFRPSEVGAVCFNDDVEITVYDGATVVATHQLSGFVFLNSLQKKKMPNGAQFMVIKI